MNRLWKPKIYSSCKRSLFTNQPTIDKYHRYRLGWPLLSRVYEVPEYVQVYVYACKIPPPYLMNVHTMCVCVCVLRVITY